MIFYLIKNIKSTTQIHSEAIFPFLGNDSLDLRTKWLYSKSHICLTFGGAFHFTLNPKYSTWHSHTMARITRAAGGADATLIKTKLTPINTVIAESNMNFAPMVISRLLTKA